MSVLQRKAQVGKQDHQARAMTVPKSLRIGLAKVADEVFEMALAVIGVVQDNWVGDEIDKKLDEAGLLMLLDGPDGATGGAVFDVALVTAMVQQQTTGRVSETPTSERHMTATDAALCAPLLDAVFQRANGMLETTDDKDRLPLYKFGAYAENRRLFSLALKEPEYRVLRLTVDIAGGVAQSSIILILPVQPEKQEVLAEDADSLSVQDTVTIENTVMGLRAELTAVLSTVKISLSDLGMLSPGDALPISAESFEAVRLMSIEGREVATGAMGQIDGQRALMLAPQESTGPSYDVEGSAMDENNEEPSDYANLNLPDLEFPSSSDLIETDANGEILDLSSLPDVNDLEHTVKESDVQTADLPDLPDLPELDDAIFDIDDLPKVNTA